MWQAQTQEVKIASYTKSKPTVGRPHRFKSRNKATVSSSLWQAMYFVVPTPSPERGTHAGGERERAERQKKRERVSDPSLRWLEKKAVFMCAHTVFIWLYFLIPVVLLAFSPPPTTYRTSLRVVWRSEPKECTFPSVARSSSPSWTISTCRPRTRLGLSHRWSWCGCGWTTASGTTARNKPSKRSRWAEVLLPWCLNVGKGSHHFSAAPALKLGYIYVILLYITTEIVCKCLCSVTYQQDTVFLDNLFC